MLTVYHSHSVIHSPPLPQIHTVLHRPNIWLKLVRQHVSLMPVCSTINCASLVLFSLNISGRRGLWSLNLFSKSLSGNRPSAMKYQSSQRIFGAFSVKTSFTFGLLSSSLLHSHSAPRPFIFHVHFSLSFSFQSLLLDLVYSDLVQWHS